MLDFRGAIKEHLSVSYLYAKIDTTSLYVFDFAGLWRFLQIYHKDCKQSMCIFRKTQKGAIYSCDKCDALRWVCVQQYVLSLLLLLSSNYLWKLFATTWQGKEVKEI